MNDTRQPSGWRVIVDVRVTRRKFYHCIVDPDDKPRFSSKYFDEVIAWLYAEGVTDAELQQAEPSATWQHIAPRVTLEQV